jgi:ankyrin repeat protein
MRRTLWLIFATALTLSAAIDDDLLEAARKGDLTAVKALVGKGAAIETKTPYGQTPLYLAAMSGHADVVAFLLDKGASTAVRDTFYKAPMLGFVLQRKHYGVAKMLIAKGADSADENLSAVARTGNLDLVQAVLDKGKPSQSALDKSYESALDQKQSEIAELLKKAGAQPPAPPVQVDAKVLESYAGTYKSEQFPLDVKMSV